MVRKKSVMNLYAVIALLELKWETLLVKIEIGYCQLVLVDSLMVRDWDFTE